MRAVLIGVVLLLSGGAWAEGWLTLTRGDEHRLELGLPAGRKVVGYVAPPRSGWTPLDAWFQVAPGGKALATWSLGGNGLRLYLADGTLRHQSKVRTLAFRFSPDGARLAVATGSGLDLVEVATGERTTLARRGGIAAIHWTSTGLVALVRHRDVVAYAAGIAPQVLARGRRIEAFGARGEHVAWCERGVLVVDGVRIPLASRDPVRHLEVAADGRVLFATAKQVWLRPAEGPPALVVDEADVHSLFFSPDGSQYLWASRARGAVVGPTPQALPGTLSVRFREDAPGLVVTTADGVSLGERRIAGIGADDGETLAGHVLASEVPLALFRIKSAHEKMHQVPAGRP